MSIGVLDIDGGVGWGWNHLLKSMALLEICRKNRSIFTEPQGAKKKMLLKILLPNITDELSMEANSVDPEQTAPRSSLIWVHTVCHRGFLNISADKESRRLLLRFSCSTLLPNFYSVNL